MIRKEKQLTNMIWRSMGESILFSMLLCVAVVYFLLHYKLLVLSYSWSQLTFLVLTGMAGVALFGAGYGYWHVYRLKKKLDLLSETMLFLEKGNLSRQVPSLGEDEIGRLGVQLNRITKRWEEQVSSLQRLSTDNAELAEKAKFSAVVEERQRLARELHDAVSQQLFAISMTATAVGRTLEKDFDKAQRQISLIEEMSSVAQSEMRALLLHLRPVHLEGKRLADGLHELLQELRAKVPINIGFDMDDNIRLTRGIEDHLFRIVQEALSNTLRHSKATEMHIRLQQRPDFVRLSIRDNGIGFAMDAKRMTSYGLVSMKERVNELGGSIDFITAPGKGTRIEIRVPLIMQEGNGDHV